MSEDVDEEEAGRLGAAGCAAGCVAAPILLFVILIAWAVISLLFNPPAERATPFPSALPLGAQLAYESGGAGREGCRFLAHELDADIAAAIAREGLAYFAAMTLSGESSRLSPWRETPLGAAAARGPGASHWTCAPGGETAPRFRAARRAVAAPGAYYAMSADGSGIIIVIPSERLAIYHQPR